MKCGTVNKCCFCINLKSAGIAMGVFGVLINCIYIALGYPEPMWALHLNYVGLVFNASWLYGVVKKAPCTMLPILILTLFVMVILIITPTISIIYYFAIRTHPESTNKSTNIRWVILCSIFYCSGALCYYLWMVQYSLYKLIKETAVTVSNEHKYGA